MSQITKDINKITGTIIGVSGKLILYALILLLLTEGIVRGYAFGHTIFYQTPMEPAPGQQQGSDCDGRGFWSGYCCSP